MNRHLSEYRVQRKSSVYGGCCSRNLLQTASEGGQRAAVYAVGSWRPHVSMCHSSGMSKFLILLVLCKCQRSGDTAWVLSWSLSPPPLSWAISQEHRRTVPGVILRLCKDLDWSNIVPGKGFPGGTEVKKFTCQCRRWKRLRFDPWVRKIPEGGNGNPLQYSCLENPVDRGNWQATVHGVAESDTNEWLSKRSWNGVFGASYCTRCYHLASWIVGRQGRGPRRGAWEAGAMERILSRPWARVPYQLIWK